MLTPTHGITAEHNARLTERDPWVGPLTMPTAADPIHVGSAVGACLAISRVADDPLGLWGPRRQSVLQIRTAEPADEPVLGPLLDRWIATTELRGEDAAYVCRLPVADHEAARPLLRRGFVPTTTTVVSRVASSPPGMTPPEVRPVRAGDREAVLDLVEAMHASDVAWGGSVARRDARRLLATYVDEASGDRGGHAAWVADQGAGPVGFLAIASPQEAAWAAAATTLTPIAYLGLAAVAPAARGHGVGSALEAAARHQARAWGAAGIVLDHAALSPLSSTFWHRRGYLPLLTTWMRPATA